MNTSHPASADLPSVDEIERRLRLAFAHRAATTFVDPTPTIDLDPLPRPTRASPPPRRPRVAALAAAALIAVVVVAASALRNGHSVDDAPSAATPAAADPGSADAPASVRLTDPLAIDLDALTVALPIATEVRFLQVDTAHLPDGWTLVELSANTFPAISGLGTFSTGATLRAPWGDEYHLHVGDSTASAAPPPADAEEITLGDGSIGRVVVRRWNSGPVSQIWFDVDGFHVHGAADDGAPGERDTLDHLVALAQVPFVATATLPYPVLDPDASGGNEPELAGTLGGAHWGIDVPERGRAMWSSVAGAAAGGVEDSEAGAGTTVTAASSMVSFDGVPGYGLLLYGWGPPSVTEARAVLRDGSTVTLPVYRRDDATFFAAPVPLGLPVERIELLSDVVGSTARVRWSSDLPHVPIGYLTDERIWSPGPAGVDPAAGGADLGQG